MTYVLRFEKYDFLYKKKKNIWLNCFFSPSSYTSEQINPDRTGSGSTPLVGLLPVY